MKIRYLDGKRLYYAVMAGGKAVIADQAYLNKINVFPVADADTGTNMASTMRAIARRARACRTPKETLASVADAALVGARGNSGIIFAQFLVGLSRELKQDLKMSTLQFAEAVKRAVPHARQAVVSPVDGTILSVMHDWAESLYRERQRFEDYVELLAHSLKDAEISLKETTSRLSALAKSGVVDAGAKGFLDFIQGISSFIGKGDLKAALQQSSTELPPEPLEAVDAHRKPTRRYCTEAFMAGDNLDLDAVRKLAEKCGNSVVVAGGESKMRVHFHTNKPSEFFAGIEGMGQVLEVKADDMKRQYEAAHDRISTTALVTDSTCDLPQDILDRYQINVMPYNLVFGEDTYLDRVTMEPDRFYAKLKECAVSPTSAQPSPESLRKLFDFLTVHYKSVLAVTMSSVMSGLYNQLKAMADSLYPGKVSVINSRHMSCTLGLMVVRAAEALAEGRDPAELAAEIESWPARTRMLVDIDTLKYMMMSGRVTRRQGSLVQALHIKPIITIDEEGRSKVLSKSFSRNANMKKILGLVGRDNEKRPVWNYSIVHARNIGRANEYAEKLERLTGKPPLFINEISPVVATHVGIGVVAIAVMS